MRLRLRLRLRGLDGDDLMETGDGRQEVGRDEWERRQAEVESSSRGSREGTMEEKEGSVVGEGMG